MPEIVSLLVMTAERPSHHNEPVIQSYKAQQLRNQSM